MKNRQYVIVVPPFATVLKLEAALRHATECLYAFEDERSDTPQRATDLHNACKEVARIGALVCTEEK